MSIEKELELLTRQIEELSVIIGRLAVVIKEIEEKIV